MIDLANKLHGGNINLQFDAYFFIEIRYTIILI